MCKKHWVLVRRSSLARLSVPCSMSHWSGTGAVSQGQQTRKPNCHLCVLDTQDQGGRTRERATSMLDLHPSWPWGDGDPEGDQTSGSRQELTLGESGSGLFVARAVTRAPVATGSCLPSERQVHGWTVWLSLYKLVSTLLLWPTGWSMDMELISSSSPKMGNPDCAVWTMWVHRLCRVALQTSITCVTTMDFFQSLNQWLC